jgi:hypothetical protein
VFVAGGPIRWRWLDIVGQQSRTVLYRHVLCCICLCLLCCDRSRCRSSSVFSSRSLFVCALRLLLYVAVTRVFLCPGPFCSFVRSSVDNGPFSPN